MIRYSNFVLLLFVTGCASLPAYQDYPASVSLGIPPSDTAAGKRLGLSATYAIATQKAVIKQHKDHASNRDVLRAATFVSAIAAGGATAFGGGRDLTVALGLSTGTLLAAGSLTVDRGYDLTYLAAEQALGCIARSTRLALDADKRAQHFRGIVADAQGKLTDPFIAGLSVGDRTRAKEALEKAKVAIARISELEIAGTSLAARADVSVDDVVGKARAQITAQQPDRAAFAAALGSVGTLGLGAASQIASPSPGKAAAPPAPPPVPPAPAAAALAKVTTPEDEKILNDAISAINVGRDGIEAAIASAETDGKTALESCGFKDVEVASALSVAGVEADGSVSLKSGLKIDLQVNGGTGDYFAKFVGIQPPGIQLSIFGDTVSLEGQNALVPANTYTLRIRDSARKGQSKDISVKTVSP